ncbi:hypothetical protein J7W19_02210 [Streptomyces mobaraensis NBRC 13819 = DSM 40847]|uniref:Uncharacterized protein n=1 Tax=Streptomyces mobaraensis (strain ATCC 29032 / DSM 40847 / JCM 4168 / NBRC 13819 / NCIMB 11159 / IPCR 16-22) TaxID=1223523 RepID=M3CAG9_STRM1|nr:hypothetical protein [Streptomyces mobaraensis]EMF00926.1 hypothetical protein H340_08616 [Streptomyces mobaraensis NBRC 13819 = DSM 40847]QTT72400.1 hypothetical protein J7W19_02210 [Streptomyces mobaraensis NBRC 13819 = DSM 40847]
MEINKVLVRAFVSVVVSIDLSDDEDIDPDVATDILEPAAAIFRELSEEGRREVAALMLECAESEENPERKRVMIGLPEAIGLRGEG